MWLVNFNLLTNLLNICMRNFKTLDVWKDGILLCMEVYKTTKTFPKNELYGITSQIQRSAVSIPSNIAEGAGKDGDREFNKFLSIALGSAFELETQLIICRDVGYLTEEKFLLLANPTVILQKMIYNLKLSLILNPEN